jgi:cytoskeletal protein RodZ
MTESDSLGPRLKEAREARGVQLREIATASKISMAALESLERGDFSRLPGGIYARSFIRSYAEHVGLDPEETVKAFTAEMTRREREAARVRTRPVISADDRAFLERQQRALRALRITAIVVAVLVLGLLVWQAFVWWPGRGTPADPAVEPAPSTEVRVPMTPPPPADPVPARAETPAPPDRERLTVAFEVSGECWVQVTADGLVVLQRILRAGERQSFTVERQLVLDIGNAGVFSWSINGEPAQALGRQGRHRQVTVTRENAQTFLR